MLLTGFSSGRFCKVPTVNNIKKEVTIFNITAFRPLFTEALKHAPSSHLSINSPTSTFILLKHARFRGIV